MEKGLPIQQHEIRCGACSRKLGSGQFTHLQIKCPRCGAMNILKAIEPLTSATGSPGMEATHVSREEAARQERVCVP